MDHVLLEGAAGTLPRRAGLKRTLPVIVSGLIVAAAGYWTWNNWPNTDPVHLIKRGTVLERQKAAADLGSLEPGTDIDRVMTALVGAMDDEDFVVRSTAEEALGFMIGQMLSRPGPVTPQEQDRTGRRLALAIQTLTKGLSDPEPTIRASAAFGLGRLGQKQKVDLPPELVTALVDESPAVRQAATKTLNEAQLTASVVPALITALGRPEPEVRFQATQSLGRVGSEAEAAVPVLLTILKEPFDRKERVKSRTPAWMWDPACGAATALAQIGASREVIAGLGEMLSADVLERMSAAANALEKLGPRAASAAPSLIAAYDKVLKSKDHVLGQSAISAALGRIAPDSPAAPEAVAILIRSLDSDDTWVRVGAAQALGKFGRDAAGAIPRLRDLKKDPVRDLQDAAKSTLAAIESASASNAPPANPAR